jgi:hypothetical protein
MFFDTAAVQMMNTACSRFTFDLPKTKCIVHDGDRQDVRLLLLSQEVDPQGEQQQQQQW